MATGAENPRALVPPQNPMAFPLTTSMVIARQGIWEASLYCEVSALRDQVALLNKLPRGVVELGFFTGAADGMEARRYRDSRKKHKEFKIGIGGGMSHIGMEGHFDKEEDMWEEDLKKKQKTKDNREVRKTQSGLDTIAKNIAREKKKE